MRCVKRGDVFYAELPVRNGSVQSGRRPVVVTQVDALNRGSTTVIAAAITSVLKKPDARYHVIIEDFRILPKTSMVMAEQRFTLNKDELLDYRGRLAAADMKRISRAIAYAEGSGSYRRRKKRARRKRQVCDIDNRTNAVRETKT